MCLCTSNEFKGLVGLWEECHEYLLYQLIRKCSITSHPDHEYRMNVGGHVQIRSVRQSHSNLASGVGFAVFSTEDSLLFCFAFYAANTNNLTWLLRSPLARAPYVVLFDLKPLIEDGNLQV